MIRLSLSLACALAALPSCTTTSRGAAPGVSPGLVAAEPAVAGRREERPSRRELVRRILPQNVRVYVYDADSARGAASGVAIGAEIQGGSSLTYVLTNAHAIDTSGMARPRIAVLIEADGEVSRHPAEVVAAGSVPDMDLALLKVPGVRLPLADLAAEAELEPGEDVVVAAAPYGRSISISGGMVSQVERDRRTRRPVMLKTDAPIGYGASGGGIYSVSTGRLLAIVEGYRTAKVDLAVANQPYSFDIPMPGETFAAPSTKVRAFLESKGLERLLERPAGPVPGPAQAALQ